MLTLKQVQTLIEAAITKAENAGLPIAVCVCDTHGELLGFVRMDNVNIQAGLLAQNKAYTSARDRQPSGNLGAWARETGKTLAYWTDPKITGFKGGLPIEINGELAGGIGISGMSEDDDESFAASVLKVLV
ncbi:heme-binding protein [Photobacterium sp. OFAV2-7]|uniref:GlcG/HbpS family heme-binding protein n=1 Tax=Photobacterium sp. OFAV2-7 TaxID=2917748 RepID=UPI001EF42740|nr:heme-binding protein [Photobacterium sp. OFAV2-7]MCG7588121.1 heme-binding protein [Photobacterium sp. OFAV2-7]